MSFRTDTASATSDAAPGTFAAPLLRNALLTLAGSAVIALSAQVAVPLPWTPVPLTGQTFGVLLTAMLLGGRRGAAACALYLCEGAAGLPVFAGGLGGVAPLLGATGGYLAAFPVAAWATGSLAERGATKHIGAAFGVAFLGSLLILLLGSLRLGLLVGDISTGLVKGFAPFVAGETMKTATIAVLVTLSAVKVRRGNAPKSL